MNTFAFRLFVVIFVLCRLKAKSFIIVLDLKVNRIFIWVVFILKLQNNLIVAYIILRNLSIIYKYTIHANRQVRKFFLILDFYKSYITANSKSLYLLAYHIFRYQNNYCSKIKKYLRNNIVAEINQVLIRTSSYSNLVFSLSINQIILITLNALQDWKDALKVKSK